MNDITKAQLGAFLNAAGALLIAFHVILTTEQLAAVGVFVNAALSLWLTWTHKTRKRTP